MNSNSNLKSVQNARARVDRAAWFLDGCFRIPGTPWRFGWDAIIGLVPGLGDWAASLLSLWILAESWLLRAPLAVLLRMTVNVGVGFVIGIVPLIGDLFDLAWRANARNAKLFARWTERPGPVAHGSKLWLALFALGILVLMVVAIALGIWILQLCFGWASAYLARARS